MSNFSQRFGYVNAPLDLRSDEMPETLRNGLWDVICLTFFQSIAKYDFMGRQEDLTPHFRLITNTIWFDFFRKTIDSRSGDARKVMGQIREFFFAQPFYGVYDFIEFLANIDIDHFRYNGGGQAFAGFCDRVLERERSAFRFAGTTLVQVSNEIDLNSVKSALEDDIPSAVRSHIRRAAELYSQRPEPDYRNSIKEAISAVEAAVRFVTGRRTVGVSRPLREVANEYSIHPALREGFEKLYAFTSDSEGVRHALMDEATVTQEDARYMLVSCSAFSNYLVSFKAARS